MSVRNIALGLLAVALLISSLPTAFAAEPEDEIKRRGKVLQFAQAVVGKQVGTGECWDLGANALRYAGARPANGYNFGKAISLPKPGFIIQFNNARFESNGSWNQMGSPHHTAVIERVNGNVITILQQNVNGVRKVSRATLDLSTKVSGSYTFYRPMAKVK